MSSPAETGPSAPKEEKKRKGLGKMLSRMSTVLRRGESSSNKRLSTMTTKPSTTGEAAKAETTPKTKAEEAEARYAATEGVTKLPRSKLMEERAQKLGERFGLEIKPSEWQSLYRDEHVYRVDKPIRMRVRRTCHKCDTSFAPNSRDCPNPDCGHARCAKCARHPPKKSEAELAASRERRAALMKANKENAPILVDYAWDERKVVISRPNKSGGQDLVYKKPRQRVRRTCHECRTMFLVGSKKCENCSHARCTDCPRDPPKKDKYPFGYPGDEFGPSSVPHFECEKCKTIYPTNADHGVECKACGNKKSEASPRVKPRKVEPEPDPEIVKKIQERMESLKVT